MSPNSQSLYIQRPSGTGKRHYQFFMTFLCLVLSSCDTNSEVIFAATDEEGFNSEDSFISRRKSLKDTLASSVLWGYLLLQVPAGLFVRRIGPKRLIFGAMMASSLCAILSPLATLNLGWTALCLIRFMQGLAQGLVIPCVTEHIAKWAPFLERNRIFSFVFVGTVVGPILSLLISEYLAASPWGWPSIFYCTGLCGILWSVVWLFVGADSPDSHPSISDSEREYIKSNLKNTYDYSKILPTPWKEIITSRPMWALILMHVCQNWGTWILGTMLPIYFHHVFAYNMNDHLVVSTLPYIIKCLLAVAFSWIVDFTHENNLMSIRASRKVWNSIAYWGGAIGLIGLSAFTSVQGSLVLLIFTVSISAGMFPGFLSNHLDLAPNFSGLLMGITSGFSTLASILAPTITGFIITNESRKDQWAPLFFTSAVTFFFGNLVFLKYGSTEVQSWNQPLKYGVHNEGLEFDDMSVSVRRII